MKKGGKRRCWTDLLTGQSTICKLVTEDHPSASRHPYTILPTHHQYFLNLPCKMHRNESFTSLTQFRPQLAYKCSLICNFLTRASLALFLNCKWPIHTKTSTQFQTFVNTMLGRRVILSYK